MKNGELTKNELPTDHEWMISPESAASSQTNGTRGNLIEMWGSNTFD